jgi:hypothetical protein
MVNISLLIGWDQYTMKYVDTHGEYLTVDWLDILMVNISLLIG